MFGFAISRDGNIGMCLVYAMLNVGQLAISYLIAFYLAETKKLVLPDYPPARSKSNRSVSSEIVSQNCMGMTVCFILLLVFLIVGCPEAVTFTTCALIGLTGNALCMYHACRLWAIRDMMEKDTRNDLTRIVQWSWLSVLSLVIIYAGFIFETFK